MLRLKFLILASAIISAPVVHAQGFIFGLLAGMMFSGAGGHDANSMLRQSGLNAIPLRCLAVESQTDYTECRWTSMMAELQAARNNYYPDAVTPYCAALLGPKDKWESRMLLQDSKGHERACDVNWHIQLEFKTLKSFNDSLQAQQKQSTSPSLDRPAGKN